jgi:hypothetical protein
MVSLNKPSNKSKLEKEIMIPLFHSVAKVFYPYLMFIVVLYIVNIILMIGVFILLFMNCKKISGLLYNE